MEEWEKLKQQVLEQIRPNNNEKNNIHRFTKILLNDINQLLKKYKIKATAEIHGSIAHDTWITGEQDLDIFIVLDSEYEKTHFKKILSILKNHLKQGWREAYAEHPYLQATINGYNVDFVPCFRISKGQRPKSSTDRTPLHTEYLQSILTTKLRDDIRLLKQFMTRIGVYGAEIKTGGFSGYLCELLIIQQGGFKELLEATIQSSLKKKIETKTNTLPLYIPDPVDPKRNVASAVSNTSYWTYVLASRKLLENPNLKFFFKPEKIIKNSIILEHLEKKGSDFLFLVIEEHQADVPDSLWGQLHKTHNALHRHLTKNDFKILQSKTWSNEKTRHIFVFELESNKISDYVRRTGPPVKLWLDAEKFIKTHLNAEDTVSGPNIQGEKLWVTKIRKWNNAVKLIKDALKDGGRNIGVSKNLSIKILQHHRVLVNTEIKDYLDESFSPQLYEIIQGRPDWLD